MTDENNLFGIESVSEIEKVANHFGRSVTSDEACSEKTDVNAEK